MRSPARTGGSRPAVRFLATFIVALAVIVIAVWARSLVLGVLDPGYGAPRPTPATLRGYALSYRIGGGDWMRLDVDDEAKACDALAKSGFLRDSCVLAVNVDPHWIATPAYGRLNTEDTPSAVAITWRAVLARDAGMCKQGGLLNERLALCQSAVASGRAEFADGSVSVAVTSP